MIRRALAAYIALIRPPLADTPAAGPDPAPGPASAQVPPQPETDREPDSLVVPAPGLAPDEADFLDGMQDIRVHAQPGQTYAGQQVADSLRTRCPDLDDHTLGVITMELLGFVKALGCGLPDAEHALQVVMDSFALAAEELTRLARNDEVPR